MMSEAALPLDTGLCIRGVIRDRPAGLRALCATEASGLRISDVVPCELPPGAGRYARPAENRQTVPRFAARLVVLPFDSEAASHTADVRADLERRGLAVVTGNLREFGRMEGRRAEDRAAS